MNARPQKEMWSRKRVTKFVGYGNKVLSKFDINCLLYKYFVSRNNEATITITDVYFPSIDPNDILTIVDHLKDIQSSESSIRAFNTALRFLKDHVAQYCRTDVKFPHLFETKNLL